MVAHEMGVSIPTELSVVAWDDSPLCRLVHPQLSGIRRDIMGYGSHAAAHLLNLINGVEVGSFEDPAPQLVPRGSTAPPPG